MADRGQSLISGRNSSVGAEACVGPWVPRCLGKLHSRFTASHTEDVRQHLLSSGKVCHVASTRQLYTQGLLQKKFPKFVMTGQWWAPMKDFTEGLCGTWLGTLTWADYPDFLDELSLSAQGPSHPSHHPQGSESHCRPEILSTVSTMDFTEGGGVGELLHWELYPVFCVSSIHLFHVLWLLY